MNILLKRTLSGILFISIVAGALFLGEYTMLLLTLLVYAISFREFQAMFRKKGHLIYLIALFAGLVFLATSYLVLSGKAGVFLLPVVATAIMALLLLYSLFSTVSLSDLGTSIFALTWLAGSSAFFIGTGWINETGAYQPVLPMILFILIWTNDVSAYLFGSRIGKHPLARRISPGKTWEGCIGGLILTSVGGWVVFLVTGLYHPLLWILTGALISLSSIAGDLFESKLKREAEVKDSGNMIPGHGGILDRFDSTFFSAPVYFIILYTWQLLA
jgi:phosphatidate cytidylyltransferase